jgi:peptide/nickel transport system substrate-binding protein
MDAWVDWDAASQTFISLGEMPDPTLQANTKCTITYPADLFTTVTWHDGSTLSVGDFILRMILQFDRAKPASAIYDESAVPGFNAFMSHFRGVEIESLDPLVITTYDDTSYLLDAELLASQETWWPNYGYSGTNPGAWHNLTPAIRGEAALQIAFSVDKANQLGVEWTNFIGGPSLGILETWMNQSAGENYIPYAPTMAQYVSAEEATARWALLQSWYTARHHFWLGTGPFYLYQASYNPKLLILTHFEAFPDVSGRWDSFTAAIQPMLETNHPSGAPGSYFNLTGSGFPPNSQAFILADNHIIGQLQVDSSGIISFTLSTDQVRPGDYHLRVSVNPSAGLLLTLDDGQSTWPREGELPIILLPPSLYIHLPMVNKN